MNPAPGNLIRLLQLLEGQLSDSETQAVQRRLRDPQLHACWRLLQRVGSESVLPQSASPQTELPAEILAAFLEGQLAEREAEEIEEQCWKSAELLREVISSYRFLYREAAPDAVTASLTGRLIDLLDPADKFSQDSRHDRSGQAADKPTAPPAVGNQTSERTVPFAKELVTRRANGVESTASRRLAPRVPRSWALHSAAAVAGIVLAVTTVAMVSRFFSRAPAAAPQVAATRPAEEPIVQPNDRPPKPPVAQGGLASTEEPNDALELPVEVPVEAAVADAVQPDAKPTVAASPPGPPDNDRRAVSEPLPEVNPSYRELAIQWDRIEGLLIGRSAGQSDWSGIRALPTSAESPHLATLPDSWATASTNYGRLVMGPDTRVQLDDSRNALQVTVRRGGVAFDDLPNGREVEFRNGLRSWTVRSTREKTAMGFVVHGEQPRLFVRRGEVTLGETRLRQGRQAALHPDGPAVSVATRASTAWFDRPQQSVQLASATRTALLNSVSIRADLDQLRRSSDSPARVLSTRWALAMFPQETLADTLAARDQRMVQETFKWLLAGDPTDPRIRQAWRVLASKTDDAVVFRALARWMRLAQQGQRLNANEALQIVRGLNHQDLLVRQMASFFLEHALGRRVQYDPQGPIAARQQAVRQWTQVVRRIYGAPRNQALKMDAAAP